MSWILIAVLAYIILAIVALGDKFLVDGVIKSAKAYALLVGVLGSVIIVISPWFLSWPGWGPLVFSLFIGALFPWALYFTYSAIKLGEASRPLILIGAITPLFTIPLSLWVFAEKIPVLTLIGCLFLLAGALVMLFISRSYNFIHRIGVFLKINDSQGRRRRASVYALVAAFIFALFFIGSKMVYNQQEFWSGFIWLRLGALVGIIVFIFRKKDRQEIRQALLPKNKKKSKNSPPQFLVLVNQSLGAAGFILQNYAISLGSVAVVNALQGVQYAFLMLLSGVLTIFYPWIFKEDLSKTILWKKVAAILLIAFGLYLISM